MSSREPNHLWGPHDAEGITVCALCGKRTRWTSDDKGGECRQTVTAPCAPPMEGLDAVSSGPERAGDSPPASPIVPYDPSLATTAAHAAGQTAREAKLGVEVERLRQRATDMESLREDWRKLAHDYLAMLKEAAALLEQAYVYAPQAASNATVVQNGEQRRALRIEIDDFLGRVGARKPDRSHPFSTMRDDWQRAKSYGWSVGELPPCRSCGRPSSSSRCETCSRALPPLAQFEDVLGVYKRDETTTAPSVEVAPAPHIRLGPAPDPTRADQLMRLAEGWVRAVCARRDAESLDSSAVRAARRELEIVVDTVAAELRNLRGPSYCHEGGCQGTPLLVVRWAGPMFMAACREHALEVLRAAGEFTEKLLKKEVG